MTWKVTSDTANAQQHLSLSKCSQVWEDETLTHSQPQKRFLSGECGFHSGAPPHESSFDRNNLEKTTNKAPD